MPQYKCPMCGESADESDVGYDDMIRCPGDDCHITYDSKEHPA